MMARGHLATGALAGLLAAPLVPSGPVVQGLFAVVTTGAALVPDMDQPGSKASRAFGWFSLGLAHIIAWLSRLLYEITCTPLDNPPGSGHRTFTHSALFAVSLGTGVTCGLYSWAPVRPFALTLGIAVALGCIAHLAGDACTLHGVPFWAPFLKVDGKRWAPVGVPRCLRFRTGATRTTKGNAWVRHGERVLTALLIGADMVAGVLIFTGWGPVVALWQMAAK